VSCINVVSGSFYFDACTSTVTPIFLIWYTSNSGSTVFLRNRRYCQPLWFCMELSYCCGPLPLRLVHSSIGIEPVKTLSKPLDRVVIEEVVLLSFWVRFHLKVYNSIYILTLPSQFCPFLFLVQSHGLSTFSYITSWRQWFNSCLAMLIQISKLFGQI
jgi:hypothetical protein